ncbi:hypothetical protein J3R30DRAFT_3734232 [Lentinula aciculospora]|uniref:Uncharacterized protein n=1 Tax=Lentinula aciculospora TaxID=153920 RepID=A0A9W9A8X2_9AGAR|nr:hypothetical protein J3R30DRAFT_3734232 [Lentinula aciculospora]
MIRKDDFRQLLRVLAPPPRFREPQVSTLTFFEWTPVLRLADMWCMDTVREHAISTMNNLAGVDPVNKVVVARECGAQDWLSYPTSTILFDVPKSFTEEDLEHLGASTLLALVAL